MIMNPNAGGGVQLPALTNPAAAGNIQLGYQAINGEGEVVTGTANIAENVQTCTVNLVVSAPPGQGNFNNFVVPTYSNGAIHTENYGLSDSIANVVCGTFAYIHFTGNASLGEPKINIPSAMQFINGLGNIGNDSYFFAVKMPSNPGIYNIEGYFE